MLRSHHRLLVAGTALALVLPACGGDSEPDDLDIADVGDPKLDGDPCAQFPGGPLSGDDLLVLINKDPDQQLRADWRPTQLVSVPSEHMMPGRSGQLTPAALGAFLELQAAAKAEADLDLGIRSAYRSFRTQCITFEVKVQQNGLEHAKKFSAEPGRSQHQLGTTADITSARVGWALEQSLGEEPEGIWLEGNAHEFGFALSYPEGKEDVTGYAWEPWHYRYIGREAAAEMDRRGLILEEYLQLCQDATDTRLACPREEAQAFEPNAGFIGGTCTTKEDCHTLGVDAVCLGPDAGYPGGYCSLSCERLCPDLAGTNSGTFCVAESDTAGMCHSRCDMGLYPNTGCRDGYHCVSEIRPGHMGNGFVCVPE